MDDRIGAAEGLGQPVDIGQVVLDELDAKLNQRRNPTRISNQGDDVVAAAAQGANDRATDKAGSAADDDPEWRPLRRSGAPSRSPCPGRLAQPMP